MNDGPALDVDVVVVGAGVAGLALATGLARRHVRVLLVDARARAAPVFKAEKLLQAQCELLDRLGLRDAVDASCTPIGNMVLAQGARRMVTLPVRQRGFLYHELVNGLRAALPPEVVQRVASVDALRLGDEVQELQLGGERVRARLVALATGLSGRLHRQLGLARQAVSTRHSLTAGVTVVRSGGAGFDFDAMMLYPSGNGRTAVTSMFRVGAGMRINVCTYQDVQSAWARGFVRDPVGAMEEAVPGTRRVAGALLPVSRPVLASTDLWTVPAPVRPGLVLVGDAFQSTCPATASGLGKALVDASVLASELVPAWLATPGMGTDKIAQYYRNARKLDSDRSSLSTGLYFRRMTLGSTRRLRVERLRMFVRLRAQQELARWKAWLGHARG